MGRGTNLREKVKFIHINIWASAAKDFKGIIELFRTLSKVQRDETAIWSKNYFCRLIRLSI